MLKNNIAVKAFIVKGGKVLLLKRSPSDKHKPSVWDIPGGRLEEGESPFEGLVREVKEEAGLEISIKIPLDVQYFTRDDGQKITMIIFYATSDNNDVILSDEHEEYQWIDINSKDGFPKWLNPVLDNINQYISLPDERVTLETYQRFATHWSVEHNTKRFWGKGFDKFEKLVPKGSSVLEIGAGSGRDAKELIPLYKYTGIDAINSFVEIAKTNNPKGVFLQQDLYSLEFPNDNFDAFWASAVLLHIPKDRINEALQSIHKVVKDGGIGFISLKQGEGEIVVKREREDGIDDTRLFSYYSEGEFTKILERNSYEKIATSSFTHESTKWLMFFVKVKK